MRNLLALLLLFAGLGSAQTLTVVTRENLIEANRNFSTTLSAGINNSTLTIPLTSGAGITISVPGAIVIAVGTTPNVEYIKLCSISGNTATACASGRGFEGTSALSHLEDAPVVGGMLTPTSLNAIVAALAQTTQALGTNLAGLVVFQNDAPATCTANQLPLWFDANATAGQNLYGCTATNTWTLLSGGAGGGGGTWGSITGDPADQTDLQALLDAKASLNIDGFVPNAELDPDEVFLKGQNTHTIGDTTAACIPLVFQLASSGTITAEFCDGVLNLGTAQIQAGSIRLTGVGTGSIEGYTETRMIRLGDDTQFVNDVPLLGHWDGLTAREIRKVSCITMGGGTETVTLNLTRNGTAILSANLVADNGGQSSCASTFDTCDVDTIDGDEAVIEPYDKIGYDYVSDANSPTDLSCSIVWQEVPIP